MHLLPLVAIAPNVWPTDSMLLFALGVTALCVAATPATYHPWRFLCLREFFTNRRKRSRIMRVRFKG